MEGSKEDKDKDKTRSREVNVVGADKGHGHLDETQRAAVASTVVTCETDSTCVKTPSSARRANTLFLHDEILQDKAPAPGACRRELGAACRPRRAAAPRSARRVCTTHARARRPAAGRAPHAGGVVLSLNNNLSIDTKRSSRFTYSRITS